MASVLIGVELVNDYYDILVRRIEKLRTFVIPLRQRNNKKENDNNRYIVP